MSEIRKGCKDVWNAFMCEDAVFTHNDIPYCPTTATEFPKSIINWEEAKAIYKKNRIKGDTDFYNDSYVCWYIDDYKFDGPRGIWHDYNFALKVLQHFAGVITPDFSTYQDFPEPWKLYNTYRMRVYGYWLGKEEQVVLELQHPLRQLIVSQPHHCSAIQDMFLTEAFQQTESSFTVNLLHKSTTP